MTPILLAYVGVAIMVGLSGIASCIGTSIAGMSVAFHVRRDLVCGN